MPEAIDPSDPAWFPVEYDQAADAFRLASVSLTDLGRYPFLDRRMGIDWETVRLVSSADVPRFPGAQPPAFLFHTAFCGSTVLARALHAPPGAVALKEPRALMLLSHASLGIEAPDRVRFDASVAAGLRLLARPWVPGGRVLIKPTNAVNRILPSMLDAAPGARVLLLHGELEPFLYSCCRKLPEAETRLRWMAQHLLRGTPLGARLDLPPGFEPNVIEASVLTWAASIERFAQVLDRDRSDRLRSLATDRLMAAPEAAVAACAGWLGLEAALHDLPERVRTVFGRDAKRDDQDFDRATRDAQQQHLHAVHGDLVRDALEWAERVVLPALPTAPRWKPLAF